jgi:glutamate-5-semialdehyde dehydrogenase
MRGGAAGSVGPMNPEVSETAASTAIEALVRTLGREALEASRVLATTGTERKNAVLHTLSDLLEARSDHLLEENAKDLAAGREAGLSSALLDRLTLTPARLDGMIEGVRQVARLPDPVGTCLSTYEHPKGFVIAKRRVPIGVIGIIYESRPNVTIDCAALCLKSGNATILRGGKEAFHSNLALAGLVGEALVRHGLPEASARLIPTTDRAATRALLALDAYVHCLIPRGGESLVRFVAEHARMPVLKHYDGVCNVYVDTEADLAMAREIVVNAKCQRPGVCNAVENLVIHQDLLATHLPALGAALVDKGVELRADPRARAALSAAGIESREATEEDWRTEYLDLILAIRTVDSAQEAINFINSHGSGHSDAIVTAHEGTARRFQDAVDSATVYWNVSTRFTDGFEFGLGAEIGISTDRMHARGPVGLEELTSYKYVITGHGEVR